MLAQQLALFTPPELSLPSGWRGIQRIQLSQESWLEHRSGWLKGHGLLFDQLGREVDWQAEQRVMYERLLDVPRLVASLPRDGDVPPILERASTLLSERYGRNLSRLGLCMYRGGQDSVAWHGDRMGPLRQDTVIGILSLGEPRRFAIRPTGGGPGIGFELGWGDLLVMGGRCQEDFEHCVPKVASAMPRISVQFRELAPPPSVPGRPR